MLTTRMAVKTGSVHMRTRLHRIVCFFTTTVRPTRVPNAGCFRRIQKEWKQWHAAAWRQFKVVLWCHINRAGRLPMFTVFSCRDAIQAENEANTRYFEVRFFFFNYFFTHIFPLFGGNMGAGNGRFFRSKRTPRGLFSRSGNPIFTTSKQETRFLVGLLTFSHLFFLPLLGRNIVF